MSGSFVYLFIGRQSNSVIYSLKVWITSVVLPPVIFFIADISTNKNYSGFGEYVYDEFPYFTAIVILGGLFSFITWVIFMLVVKLIIARFASFRHPKHLIALAGALLTVGTFAIFGLEPFKLNKGFFYLALAYTACIVGGSYFYKLKIEQEPEVF